MGGRSSGSSLTPKPSKEERNIYKKIEKGEKGIRDNNYETAIVYDRNGNEILRKKGEEHSVGFEDYEAQKLTDNILTHNHPGDGIFSYADINMLVAHNSYEVRAVGKTWLYSLQRIGSGPTEKATEVVKMHDYSGRLVYAHQFAKDIDNAYNKGYDQAFKRWRNETLKFRIEHGKDDFDKYCAYWASRYTSDWLKAHAHEYGYKYTTKRKRGVKGDVQW